jgi:hypothetical protein
MERGQDMKCREDKIYNGERTRYKMERGQDIKWREDKI